MNVLPLFAFGPLDTVHKNKRSDERFGQIEDGLELAFVKQRINFV